jgi:predicted ATPase
MYSRSFTLAQDKTGGQVVLCVKCTVTLAPPQNTLYGLKTDGNKRTSYTKLTSVQLNSELCRV